MPSNTIQTFIFNRFNYLLLIAAQRMAPVSPFDVADADRRIVRLSSSLHAVTSFVANARMERKNASSVSTKPFSYRPLFDGENRSRECQICFNETPCTRGIYTACGHVFCYTCIVQIPSKSQSTCPFCRVKSMKIVILKEKKIEKTENIPTVPTAPAPPKSKFILTHIASRVRTILKSLFKRH